MCISVLSHLGLLKFACVQMNSMLVKHRVVQSRYGFVYEQYTPSAWYWEEVRLL